MSEATKRLFSELEACPQVRDALKNVKQYSAEAAEYFSQDRGILNQHVAISVMLYGNQELRRIITPEEISYVTDIANKLVRQLTIATQIPRPMAPVMAEAHKRGLL